MGQTTDTTIDDNIHKSKDTTHFVFISWCDGLVIDEVYYMWMIYK